MPRDGSRFTWTLSLSVQSSRDLTKTGMWNSYCLFFCLINNGNSNKSGNVYISVVQTFTKPILCSVFTTLISCSITTDKNTLLQNYERYRKCHKATNHFNRISLQLITENVSKFAATNQIYLLQNKLSLIYSVLFLGNWLEQSSR
jgi:hypothetical protein